jgi:prepilin-type N-terminal cleavage/methylation domain-containing protein
MRRFNKQRAGFALVEILIAITILSMLLLSIFTSVSASIGVISGTKNYTRAMIIAKSKMNEFILLRMRGADISKESVEEYRDFTFSRETQRYENEFLGPILAQKTDITVFWKEKQREKKYTLSYIYAK